MNTDKMDLLLQLATLPAFVEGDLERVAHFVTHEAGPPFQSQRVHLWEILDSRAARARVVEVWADRPTDALVNWVPSTHHVRRLQSGNPLVVSDLLAEFGDDASASSLPGARAILQMPVRSVDHVAGVLCFDDLTGPREWTEEEIRVAEALANHVGHVFAYRDSKFRGTEAMRVSEVYQRAITAAGAAPYIETYDPNEYVFMGDQITKLTGYTPEEFTPDLLSDITVEYVVRGPGTGMDLQEAVDRARRGEFEYWQCDMAIETKAGDIRWISETSVEHIGADGRSHDSIGILLDITDRVVAEREVRRIEEIYRRAITAAGAVPYVHAYFPDERYTFVDPGILKLTGYRPDEISPQKMQELTIQDSFIGDKAGMDIEEAVARARSGKVPVWHADSAIRTKSGAIRWISDTSVEMLGPDGRSEGSIGMLQDVTDRKNAEEDRLAMQQQLLHTQKLESLGILAGGIAHDFNNLLVAIVGNIELALERTRPESTLGEYLRPALEASCRASDLSRQMLAYSGKGRFVVTDIDLSDVVEKNALMLRSAVSRNVDLRLSLERPLPTIKADAGQIQQIVMNLITNAAEAISDAKGTVVLSTGSMNCDIEYLKNNRSNALVEPGPFVYVDVADTGCGMTNETRSRLFDPFYTTKFTGRGLGMSAVLGIVRGHKGAIVVNSDPEAGSQIRVLFPVVEQPSPILKTPVPIHLAKRVAPERSRLVLVVDDEDMVRTLCRRMLERLGHEVLIAKDGVEGVEMFQERANDIDCVILDLTMPRLDGQGAFTQMKAIRPDVKVILLSGYSEEQVSEAFTGEGLAGFIQKPFRIEQLKNELERIS